MPRQLTGLFALVTALLFAPAPAFPCPGSSGGSSSSDSSSDSSSSSSSSDSSSWSDDDDYDDDDDDDSASTPLTPSCDASTVIHGRAGCRRFGYYDTARHPRLHIAFGTSGHRLSLDHLDASGFAEHDTRVAYRVTSEDIGPAPSARARTFDMRVQNAVGRHAYVGFQGSIGSASMGERPIVQGELTLVPDGGIYGSIGAHVGAGFSGERWSMHGEVEVGRQFMSLQMETHHLNCVNTTSIRQDDNYIRPRAIVQVWLSPWVTVGASLASNIMRKGDLSGGLHMGFHLRSFDGSLRR